MPDPETPREPVLHSRALDPGAAGEAAIPFATEAGSVPLDSMLAPRPAAGAMPAAGQRIGDYEVLEPVGAGGFSIVMKARHLPTGNVVALKLPRVPAFLDHLRREAHVAARFQDPQVVGILESGLDRDPPFLAMPYIDGANLPLPEAPAAPAEIGAAFRKFRQVAEVVGRMHRALVAHGDLKPGNIRFDSGGACHILDLGVARQQLAARQLSTLRASVVSVTGERIAGTLEYMAPETMSGAPPDRPGDVYALGVLLHHMLCGRPPAFGVSPAALNPFLPPGTQDFLRQMLHHDPARRIPDAEALLPTVDAFVRAEARCLRRRNGHARRRVFLERMRTLARGARILLVSAAVAFVVFGLGAWARQVEDLAHNPAIHDAEDVVLPIASIALAVLAFVALLLGMTTINAWLLGIPEKTYKNRNGHPLWNFMMQ